MMTVTWEGKGERERGPAAKFTGGKEKAGVYSAAKRHNVLPLDEKPRQQLAEREREGQREILADEQFAASRLDPIQHTERRD